MTQDEIIEMVWQSDLGFLLGDSWMMHHELEAFAKLVAAKEREACAQTCENLPIPNQFSESEGSVWDVAALDCAEAIRARGQA
jgi:hypothetical protein